MNIRVPNLLNIVIGAILTSGGALTAYIAQVSDAQAHGITATAGVALALAGLGLVQTIAGAALHQADVNNSSPPSAAPAVTSSPPSPAPPPAPDQPGALPAPHV